MGVVLLVLLGLWMLFWGAVAVFLFLLNSGNLAFLVFVFIANPPLILYLLYQFIGGSLREGSEERLENYGWDNSGWVKSLNMRRLLGVTRKPDIYAYWSQLKLLMEWEGDAAFFKFRDGRDTPPPVDKRVIDFFPKNPGILYHLPPEMYDGVHDLFIEHYPLADGDGGQMHGSVELVGVSWMDMVELIWGGQVDKYDKRQDVPLSILKSFS